MTTFEDEQASVVSASGEASPFGATVVIIVAGKREVSMSAVQAADYGAFLVQKAAQALERQAEAEEKHGGIEAIPWAFEHDDLKGERPLEPNLRSVG